MKVIELFVLLGVMIVALAIGHIVISGWVTECMISGIICGSFIGFVVGVIAIAIIEDYIRKKVR